MHHIPTKSRCRLGVLTMEDAMWDSMRPVLKLWCFEKNAQKVSEMVQWAFFGCRKAEVRVKKTERLRILVAYLYPALGITGLTQCELPFSEEASLMCNSRVC